MAEAREVPPGRLAPTSCARSTPTTCPRSEVLQPDPARGAARCRLAGDHAEVPHWHRGRMVLVGDAAHAPSSSSGQGASLSIESAIQLARCLRDLPDLPTAFATYERLRRTRVEKIAANAAKNNRQKAFGPVGSTLMSVLMPIAMKTFLKPEKMFGPVHGYRIDWDETVRT